MAYPHDRNFSRCYVAQLTTLGLGCMSSYDTDETSQVPGSCAMLPLDVSFSSSFIWAYLQRVVTRLNARYEREGSLMRFSRLLEARARLGCGMAQGEAF